MRIISSEELNLVAGGGAADHDKIPKKKDDGGFFSAIGSMLSSIFGGGSASGGNTCVPSSNTSNGVTTSQTCGANGTSTTTVSGPGYVIVQNVGPNAGGSGSISLGRISATGGYKGGSSMSTSTFVNGRVSTTH
jgi:hypothetical protein